MLFIYDAFEGVFFHDDAVFEWQLQVCSSYVDVILWFLQVLSKLAEFQRQ